MIKNSNERPTYYINTCIVTNGKCLLQRFLYMYIKTWREEKHMKIDLDICYHLVHIVYLPFATVMCIQQNSIL